jgi:glycosyltransferase involved in cell wall biosynthesis
VPQAEVAALLRGYHVIAVPTRGVETGPLVVLEAFAAGTPVVGSRLGGIAELVEHEVNGLLVSGNHPRAWAAGLQRLADDRNLLRRLRSGVPSVRSEKTVAVDMAALYRSLLASRVGAPVGLHG